jgi:hypothetical protein
LVAADSGYGDGLIYTSDDGGVSWTPTSAPVNPWTSVASSADGVILVAADSGDGDDLIYVSTDAGGAWASNYATIDQWASVASSADGSQLVAADSGYGDGLIYTSTNAGGTWTPTTALVEFWTSVTSSADGSRLAATGYPGGVFTWQSIPVLNILHTNGSLCLSWEALSSATGFVLQQDTNLASTNWIAMTNTPAQTNGLYQIVVPLSPGDSQFYRLEYE